MTAPECADCPLCANAAAIWAAAQAAADEPFSGDVIDEPAVDDDWASDAGADRAADYHYRRETTPYWRTA